MTEIDVDAVNEAIQTLTAADYVVDDVAEEWEAAGNFVHRFGALGAFLEEPNLSSAQMWVGPTGSAFTLIGHWSVLRNDPAEEPDAGFEEHASWCGVCSYLEAVLTTRRNFEFENCETCGGGIESHAVVTLPIGKPGLVCVGQWQRCQPEAFDAGTKSFSTQRGEAWGARWFAPLADGRYAVVTRSYFVDAHDGRITLSRVDDYTICEDPNDPEGTEIDHDFDFREIDSDNPRAENIQQLAVDSFPPDPGEWQEFGPRSANFAVPVAA